MFASLLVVFYRAWHGSLHLPGAGWLIRRLAPVIPGLQHYPLAMPDVGTAVLDFRDSAAIGLLNFLMGELANDGPLHRYLGVLLKPGYVFWDIGANIGVVSCHFAQARYQLAGLHAFEPNPVPYKTLQTLFAAHPSARAHNFGLGASQDTISLALSGSGSEIGSAVRNHESGKKIQVEIRRGDDLIRDLHLAPPDVLKIDVEGFEPSVFAGLAQTIATHRPAIVFEHIWLSDEEIRQLIPEGYTLRFILDDGKLESDFAVRRNGHDAVLLPAEKADSLDSAGGDPD